MPLLDVRTVSVLARAGVLRPVRPDRLLGAGLALAAWGAGPAGGYAIGAVRQPDRVALADPAGALTCADIHRRSGALACGLAALGIGPDDPVGILAGNARGFVESAVALAKLGATAVLLNTGLGSAALAAVVDRERIVAVLTDAGPLPLPIQVLDPAELGTPYDGAQPRPPSRRGRTIILTSGTTGIPKGAVRDASPGLDPAVALLSAIPLRAHGATVIAPPLFHAWGYAHWLVGILLSSTAVLTGGFDAEATLAAVARHRATALIVVPVMLQRLLDLPPAVLRRHDTTSLRVIAVSGSALSGDLAARALDAFGPVLYNLYGSTEVGWASIAGPDDLRDAPGTAGRPPPGIVLRLLDPSGSPVEPGQVGRIAVGTALAIDRYTGGSEAPAITAGGLIATGDLGRLDPAGRLYVVGRADDMIVSGGENVFPGPVEDCIALLDGVAEVAVVGVPDPDYGERLRAVVVRNSGASVTADDVRAHVRSRLARFAVPRDVVFTDRLPRNAAGKVLRTELRS